jgi:murein DD-endopeptidase MepM/ murein hydrolase activator NlpD
MRSWRWRLPSNKKLTFLYVPDDAAVRQFRVPRLAFHAVGGAFLVGLLLLVWFGGQWIRAAATGREMLRLKGENVALRERLDRLDEHLESLNEELRVSQEVQQRLRLMSNMDPLHPDVLAAGVGGPLEDTVSPTLPENLQGDLDRTGARLSQMLRQARLQRESYGEILTALETSQSEWDRTPSIRPLTTGFISSRFGRRMDPFTGQTAMHRGLDFVARRGTPVRATASGIVQRAARNGGYGLMVEIDHGDGVVTRYAHCSKLLVKRGEKVERGKIIGLVGSTGRSTSAHVHYEVIRNGLHQDPMKFLLPTDEILD